MSPGGTLGETTRRSQSRQDKVIGGGAREPPGLTTCREGFSTKVREPVRPGRQASKDPAWSARVRGGPSRTTSATQRVRVRARQLTAVRWTGTPDGTSGTARTASETARASRKAADAFPSASARLAELTARWIAHRMTMNLLHSGAPRGGIGGTGATLSIADCSDVT